MNLVLLNVHAQGNNFGASIMNRNCQKFGFSCIVKGGNGIQAMRSGLTPLSLSFNPATSVLSITLLQDDVENTNKDALGYLKTHNRFVNDDEVPIAAEICRKVKMPTGTIIPPGTYTISRKDDAFIITIPLKGL